MCELVIGIDPDISKIPDCYKTEQNIKLFEWGVDILTLCQNKVKAVKFQSAYFENFGLFGMETLASLIREAKNANIKVIMDAKRGDIGSTSAAYAQAYLSPRNYAGNNEFESDFLTMNPLMGEDAMMPFVDAAIKFKKGLFILLETSNPGASMILKEKTTNNVSISDKIASFIQNIHNQLNLKKHELGPIGCVIGATNKNCSQWREKLPNSLFLMPGIGAQGGDWESVRLCLNNDGTGVWVPISRGITFINHYIEDRSQYLKSVQHNLDAAIQQATNL